MYPAGRLGVAALSSRRGVVEAVLESGVELAVSRMVLGVCEGREREIFMGGQGVMCVCVFVLIWLWCVVCAFLCVWFVHIVSLCVCGWLGMHGCVRMCVCLRLCLRVCMRVYLFAICYNPAPVRPSRILLHGVFSFFGLCCRVPSTNKLSEKGFCNSYFHNRLVHTVLLS